MATEKRKDSKKRLLKEHEYERPNGTYEFKWRDKQGKRHSIYAQFLDELRKREEEVLRDIIDGISGEKATVTLNDVYQRWVQVKRGLKDNTFSNYKYMYTQYVEDNMGKRKIAEIKRTDVRGFYNYLVDECHLTANTVDNIHTVLHQVFEIAVEDDILRYNPSDKALTELRKAHNADTKKKMALTANEQKILEVFLGKEGQYHRWYPIFITLLWTGMRVGEATGLRWQDVDFDKGIIRVDHTLVFYSKREQGSCTFAVNTPKTAAGERIIPMLPIVREALLMEKQFQEDLGITCKATVDGYTDFIFLNRFGECQHQGTLNKALRRIVRDCNFEILDKNTSSDPVLLPKISNHTFRHTFATRMSEAHIDDKAKQSLLGHADYRITNQIYVDAFFDYNAQEMKKLEPFFAEA